MDVCALGGSVVCGSLEEGPCSGFCGVFLRAMSGWLRLRLRRLRVCCVLSFRETILDYSGLSWSPKLLLALIVPSSESNMYDVSDVKGSRLELCAPRNLSRGSRSEGKAFKLNKRVVGIRLIKKVAKIAEAWQRTGVCIVQRCVGRVFSGGWKSESRVHVSVFFFTRSSRRGRQWQ